MSTNDLSSPSRTQLLQAAMLTSFEGRTFEDVKFWVFSRRKRGGTVDQPKALVANSTLVRKATPHFNPVLSGGFSESDFIDMDAPYPPTMRQSVDDYGYTSDSDLESENDEDLDDQPDSTRDSDPSGILAVLEQATATILHATLKPQTQDTSTSRIPQNTGPIQRELRKIVGGLVERLQPWSDAYRANTCPPVINAESSISVEEPDTGRLDCNGDVAPHLDVAAIPSTARRVDQASDSRPTRRGRAIYLHDIAFKTWRAFLFYAYFDELLFAPLKSLKGSTAHSTGANNPYGPPACSPKSMYRLAEKYDMPALKKCAMDGIRAQLSSKNILEELFSSFTTLHPEIQAIELDYLYDNINTLTIQRELPEWIEAMEEGRLAKGASHALSSLFTKLAMGSASRRPQSQNLGSSGGRDPPRGRPECYGPHRHPRGLHTEPDGTRICDYCGGEVR
ncbi:hypothetical protein V8D89_013757 [Ganoderma adspersum]